MHWGRIKTDQFMRVPGQDGVWALGDAALIPMVDKPSEDPPHYATQTAQFAVREGRQLAANIVAKIEGNDAQALRLYLEGLARLARHEQGGRRRLRHQALGHARLAPVARLLSVVPAGLRRQAQGRRQLAAQQRHAAQYRADPVDAAGHALHPLPQGRQGVRAGHADRRLLYGDQGPFKLTIDNPETGEHFEKVFGPGEHFGERVLLRSALRTGLVVALEDGVLLFIAQKDFTRFARAFPFLDNYFKDYIERTFGGTDKSFAPGSTNHKTELETLPWIRCA